MLDKERAVLELKRMAELHVTLHSAVDEIVKTNPLAIMFVWETLDGYKIASVPHSVALTKGLMQEAYDMVFEDQEDVATSDATTDDGLE